MAYFYPGKSSECAVCNPRPVSGHFQSGRQITQKVQNTPDIFNPRAGMKHSSEVYTLHVIKQHTQK